MDELRGAHTYTHTHTHTHIHIHTYTYTHISYLRHHVDELRGEVGFECIEK